MDKKFKYIPSSTTKSTTADSKKSQDVIYTKTFPKISKKRELPGASGYSKNEQTRKQGIQKTKNFDKRPKPKGQYYGGSKENSEVDNEELAEISSAMVPGSNKQNLNHLLNFHYESREIRGSNSGSRSYGRLSTNYNGINRGLPSTQRHRYNKEQFLQANCQFVVNKDGDYTVYLVDPDIFVDWKLIEQIRIHTTESLSCPICLGSPVAGKMTRCGHVYCWPCILHYLSLSDKSWRKCPICYESVYKNDLKSVIEVTQINMNIGDIISLRLMRRKRGSLLAIPVEEHETSDPPSFFSVSDNPQNQIYSKLLLADVDDILKIIEGEKTQLQKELVENLDSPESCFIQQALQDLSVREEHLLKQVHLGESDVKVDEIHVENNIDIHQPEKISINDYIKENETDGHLLLSNQNSPKFFYFYQAEDGQNIYLHAMNVKMLEVQYGSLEKCPRIISGKLLEKETRSYTEDLRKRLRYLYHLPLTCMFEMAEIKLTPPLISDIILDLFEDQIKARECQRKRRDREEKKREKKINAEESKRLGKYPISDVYIESRKHFPTWQPEFQSPNNGILLPSESVGETSIASSLTQNTVDDNEPNLSFAQMLRNENSKISSLNPWPSISPLVSWKKLSKSREDHNFNIRNDDEFTAPSYSQNFGDVIAQALEQTELTDQFGNDKLKQKKIKKKKKKKCHSS
ncbi:RING finger protein 10 [Chelonus insularis]|uniref:RING finger protein 10 n=1 Tax=Chelonus insularis TaxID=460826 RepID=UPI00158AC755|nr:RING finger protein 10 [Chelonus insularis]